MLKRRAFAASLLAVLAAPAIVRAQSIMAISPPRLMSYKEWVDKFKPLLGNPDFWNGGNEYAEYMTEGFRLAEAGYNLRIMETPKISMPFGLIVAPPRTYPVAAEIHPEFRGLLH